MDQGQTDENTYRELASRLREAADAYYNTDTLVMDDAEYDRLARTVVAIEKLHPEWVEGPAAESVAAGVGASGTVRHDPPLLSLDNVFDSPELAEFCKRAPDAVWVVEAKLDGLAAAASYRDGKLVSLATRGDGINGEDLMGHFADILGLPATLDDAADLDVRGEIYMDDAQFETANAIRQQHGDRLLANPRNGAAGAMRARHGRYRLPVRFAAYAWPSHDHLDHADAVDLLEKLGIACAASLTGATAGPVDTVEGEVLRILAGRAEHGFPVDGAVVKAADRSVREALGVTGRAPRWAVAYKFPADTVLTTLRDITVTVGRTGVLTPVATVDPVEVGGATVQHATCSNPSEVVRKDLRVGDRVWIRRAGDVIPEIVAVNLAERPAGTQSWQPPSVCPRCSGDLDMSSRRWRCGRRSCGAAEAVEYFASRDCMDIDGLGPGAVRALVGAGLVEDAADLYRLTVGQLAGLDGFGERKAEMLVGAIENSRGAALDRVICALGLRGTGRTISRRLARQFGSLTRLSAAGVEQLGQVEGVGTVKAALLRGELDEAAELIGRLISEGIDPRLSEEPAAGGGGPLSGMRVVVTGRIDGMTRRAAQARIEQLGGQVASGVTAEVDLVVVGEGAGSKAAAAARLDIRTMTAAEFAALQDSRHDEAATL